MKRELQAERRTQSAPAAPTGLLHRRRANQQESETLTVPPIVHNVLRSPGQPLDPATRAFMEPRFGHDFSRVRIHTDVQAAESARALNALAYTQGGDIVFGAGHHAPADPAGRQLLAHELMHVIQQTTAPLPGIYIQLEQELIPPAYLPEVRSSVANFVVSEARGRVANPYIRRAYSSQIPWFFSPNLNLKGWTPKEDILEAAKQKRKVGNALSWMKGEMVKQMPELGKDLENYPSGEGVAWWGSGVYTCNVFVFDVLYLAGVNPPLMDNGHPYDPSRIFNRSGALQGYFSDVAADQIQAGDVFATTGHTEVITSAATSTTAQRGKKTVTTLTFSSIGAGKNGVGVAESSGVSTAGKRFRRVGGGVLKANVGIA